MQNEKICYFVFKLCFAKNNLVKNISVLNKTYFNKSVEKRFCICTCKCQKKEKRNSKHFQFVLQNSNPTEFLYKEFLF